MNHIQEFLNVILIRNSQAARFYMGNRSDYFLETFAKIMNNDEDIEKIYAVLRTNIKKNSHDELILILALAYLYVSNKDHILTPYEAIDFINCSKRFEVDPEFGKMLISSYLKYWQIPQRKDLIEYAHELKIYIEKDVTHEQKEGTFTIDQIILETFVYLKNYFRNFGSDEKVAELISDTIREPVVSTGVAAQNIEMLKREYPLFIRIVYANIYAAVLGGSLVLDSDFQKEFDNHLVAKDYTPIDRDYEVKLFAYYIKVIEQPEKVILDEYRIQLIRNIYPLYI